MLVSRARLSFATAADCVDAIDRPTRLPCKLGVHRIFTVPKYRGFGISKILLDVACEKTIYGYTVSLCVCCYKFSR